MKLLTKPQVQSKVKKENEQLLDANVRLKKTYTETLNKLNSLKDDYNPDRQKLLKEFDRFCEDIKVKRSRLLKEYKELEDDIEKKKELYYGLVVKQDELEEKLHLLEEQGRTLDMREQFVRTLEANIK